MMRNKLGLFASTVVMLLMPLDSIYPLEISLSPVAKLYFSIYYDNPRNELQWKSRCDFWKHDALCDVYFVVCLSTSSNGKCDLFNTTTPVYMNQRSVVIDGRNSFEIPLYRKIPTNLWIKISALDEDTITGNDLIGDFYGSTSLKKFVNSGEYFGLNRHDADKNVRKKISIKTKLLILCEAGHYGQECGITCHPIPGRYFCSADGTKVCIEDNYCNRHGTCRINEYEMKVCLCDQKWEGENCELLVSENITVTEQTPDPEQICLNGESFAQESGSEQYSCICLDGWQGDHCEVEVNSVIGFNYSTTHPTQDKIENNSAYAQVDLKTTSAIIPASISVIVFVIIIVPISIICWKLRISRKTSQGIVYRNAVRKNFHPEKLSTSADAYACSECTNVYAECGEPYYNKPTENSDASRVKTGDDLHMNAFNCEIPPTLPPRLN